MLHYNTPHDVFSSFNELDFSTKQFETRRNLAVAEDGKADETEDKGEIC